MWTDECSGSGELVEVGRHRRRGGAGAGRARRAVARRRSSRSVSWKYDVHDRLPERSRTQRADEHPDRVRASGSSSEAEPSAVSRQLGGRARRRGAPGARYGGAKRGGGAVGVAQRRRGRRRPLRPCTSRRRRRGAAEASLAQPPRPPRARARAGSPPSGRAWSGAAQCVWMAERARAPRPRARAPEPRCARSSPAHGSGRPEQRRDREAAGPPRLQARRSAASTPSSSGRSTWQETTAYRFAGVCGICGTRDAAARPPDAERPSSAQATAIVHRGPDHGAVDAFGALHARPPPPARDRPPTGDQPVANEDGDVVAVFNGEIYNFRALRAELEAQGHRLPGTGDTPTLPHLYEEHGDAASSSASTGMFALALWDAPRERLVLARDRFGKKPLLWTQLPDGSLAFASELKALLRLPGRPARGRPRARSTPTSRSATCPAPRRRSRAINEARRPGHVSSPRAAASRVERYWQLERARRARPRDERVARARARDASREAVRKRLVADVPLGALLSGGIDSSVVVALMAAGEREPVRTFSVGFADARYDERRVRARRRRALRHRCTRSSSSSRTPRSCCPGSPHAYDEPFGDSSALPTFLVCEHRAPLRHRRARGRRRRRGLRRLRALPRARARRAARPASRRRRVARGARRSGAPVGPHGAALGARSAPRASSTPPASTRPSATAG